MNLETLYARLHAEGLLASPAVPALTGLAPPAPWYTRAMLGFAGWFAGLFIVAFFGSVIVLLFRDAFGMLLLAAALCGAAVVIDQRARNEVIAQFALALSMAGQAFFGLGLGELFTVGSGEKIAWGMVVLQAVLFVAMRSSLHRVWSVAVGAAALYFALHQHAFAGAAAIVIAVAFALASSSRAPGPDRLAPLCWGLAIALVCWAAPSLVLPEKGGLRVLETAGYGAGLLVYAFVASRDAAAQARALALGGAGLLAIAAHPAPGIVAGTLVMLAGYGARERAVVGLGIVGILGYLGAYYYQIDQTLLAKAAALATTGVALLAARFVLARLVPGERP